jgi:CelD/BcsL family acetyltransferase involved in cellulose biosynthesis
VRLILSEDGRDFVRRDWSDVVLVDPAGTFFHTPAYLKLYWEEFGEAPGHLLLAFAEQEGGKQVGAAAFELAGTTLRFLGGTEVTDYMGPVAVPESAEQMAKELFAVLEARDDWARADLGGLAEGSAWLGRLSEAAAARGLSVEVVDDKIAVAPFLPLPGSFEEYLASLPSKLRHEIKRKARKLANEAGEYRVTATTGETLAADLDRFVALHRSSEGPKGVFMQPGMEIFFRRLGEEFLPDGIFALTFLEVKGHKLAGTIGFRFKRTYMLYNSAFDHGWGHLSPGTVLVAEVIRIAIDEGCSGLDLLKGDYGYKYRFGARPRAVKRLVISR